MQRHDVCFVVDATGSMHSFLVALKRSLVELTHVARVLSASGSGEDREGREGGEEQNEGGRVGVLAYRDYDTRVTEWSGWHAFGSRPAIDELLKFVGGLQATGGGDYPEAAKTAANALIDVASGTRTLCFWYTDAPPHHPANVSNAMHGSNRPLELSALGDAACDWVGICRRMAAAGIRAFSFIKDCSNSTSSFYALLARFTGGDVLSLENVNSDVISRHTIGLFLALLGHPYDFGDRLRRVSYAPSAAIDFEAIPDELDARGALPAICTRQQKTRLCELTAAPFTARDVAAIAERPTNLVERYSACASFRAATHDMFDAILCPELVCSITYNTVFGALWRAICRDRASDRRQALVDKMSAAVSRLDGGDKARVKEYLDMSYDQTGAVEEAVARARSVAGGGVELVLEVATASRLARQELMELSRSCAPSVIARVGGLLTGLRVVAGSTRDSNRDSTTTIPLSMPAADLFAVLPHLMSGGTMFSRRPAIILAAIAASTGSAILKDKAAELFDSVRGSWIDRALPENCSAEFVALALRTPGLLTPDEARHFDRLAAIGGLLRNGQTALDVRIGYASHKTVRPDAKVLCATCGQHRSFTLMVGEDGAVVCGLCTKDNGDGCVTPETLPPGMSCWCECRTCGVHYAVVRPSELNVEPKCHFCRAGRPPGPERVVECGLCQNAFLSQLPRSPALGAPAPDPWVCPPCAHEGCAKSESVEVTVEKYLDQNGIDLGGELAGLRLDKRFFDSRSIFQAKDALVDLPMDLPNVRPTCNGKKVLNAAEVDAALRSAVTSVTSGTGPEHHCAMCFEAFSGKRRVSLLPACGRSKCSTRVCGACLDAWYGASKPGGLCLQPNLHCAFCKQTPAPKTVRRHNRELLSLREPCGRMDAAFYHGWCADCYRILPAVERQCAGSDVPALSGWRCEECVARRGLAFGSSTGSRVQGGEYRECPGCGVMTERVSGCLHITCKACETHWCWACGEASTADAIYKHLGSVHGGFWGAEADADRDYSDIEDDF